MKEITMKVFTGYNLELTEAVHRGAPPEELENIAMRLAETAEKKGNRFMAGTMYRLFDKRDKLRKLALECLNVGEYADAINAFTYLEDKENWWKALRGIEADGMNGHFLDMCLDNYAGAEFVNKLTDCFYRWTGSKGFGKEVIYRWPMCMLMAYEFADKYDVGVGLAKSALLPAYMFQLTGLDMKIARPKRKGRGATFRWVDEVNAVDFEGKKVAVIEDDVVTGRTARKVLREIKKYNPRQVDLLLVHGLMRRGKCAYGAIESRIPGGYKNFYSSEDSGTECFPEALEMLERALGAE